MIEEKKEEKKKPGLVKQILKWIGLSILVLLILLALVVEAPKKLVILLLIILAAFTALPKPVRKWFWLSVGGVVLILIIWIFLPEDNEGWQPYQYNFDKELQKLQTQYSIPPEENAATMYLQLMERYDVNDYYIFDLVDWDSDTFDKIFRNPWRSEDYPEIANRLKHIQGAIETLIEISETKQCVFPISDPYPQSDRNSAIRRWARLMVIAINNDIAEGRTDKATQKIITNLQMAKHQYQQPTTIGFLVGISIETLTIVHMNRIVIEKEMLDKHIKIIEKALSNIKNDWNSIYANTLEYDKLITITDIAMYYEINVNGRIRLSRDPWARIRATAREFYQGSEIDIKQQNPTLIPFLYPSYLQKKLIKAKTMLRWLSMPSNPEKAAAILDTCLDNYDFMAEPDFDWKKQPQEVDPFNKWNNFNRLMFYNMHIEQFIADKWVESNYSTYNTYLRMLTQRRGSRLLLAIKKYYNQHGVWPSNLDTIKSAAPAEAFIDPVTGNPLEYENHGERFSLYGETANIWPK
jgi:hypothetical protein